MIFLSLQPAWGSVNSPLARVYTVFNIIDDAVRDALSQGIEQVVILGAGLDTRPYRLAGMERTRVFEVDLSSVQEDKKKKLHKHCGRLPQQVTFLPIDFDTESLEAVFSGTPFNPTSLAIFVWEGVTPISCGGSRPQDTGLRWPICSWKYPCMKRFASGA